MKTIRFIAITTIILLTGALGTHAQEKDSFFKIEEKDGKIISRTRYTLNEGGAYEKDFLRKYFYNEEGKMIKQENFHRNEENSQLEPVSCILYTYDSTANSILAEYKVWNKKTEQYNKPSGKMNYQLDETGSVSNFTLYDKKNNIIQQLECVYENASFTNK